MLRGVGSATFGTMSYFALSQYRPFSEQQWVSLPSNVGVLVLISGGGGGTGPWVLSFSSGRWGGGTSPRGDGGEYLSLGRWGGVPHVIRPSQGPHRPGEGVLRLTSAGAKLIWLHI